MEKQQQKLMWRFYLVVLIIFFFALAIGTKILVIQWIEGPVFEVMANNQTIKNVPLQPSRGNIYAADGSILATSVPHYELRWDAAVPSKARFQQNKVALAEALATFLNQPQANIQKHLEHARKKKNRYWLVAKNLSFSEMQQIKGFPLFKSGPYKGGLIIEQSIEREHPLGKIAERTIGYEKRDSDGTFIRVGLEGAYFQYLSGEQGYRLKQKIANGQWKPINADNEKEPTEGFDLYTTIEPNMQDIAQNALLKQLIDFEALLIMRERTTITKNLIDNLSSLKFVITSGLRNKSIDLEAAKKRKVIVCGTDINKNPTPELTWALILGLARNFKEEFDNMYQGYWQTTIGVELKGKILGLLGLGNVGSQVAKIGKAFGMEIIAWSENLGLTNCKELGVLPCGKEDLIN